MRASSATTYANPGSVGLGPPSNTYLLPLEHHVHQIRQKMETPPLISNLDPSAVVLYSKYNPIMALTPTREDGQEKGKRAKE